jgi:uncharacterized OB-fold protein
MSAIPLDDTDPLEVFQCNLARGQFLIQQCRDCGLHLFPPDRLCPHCGAAALRWVEPTGHGVVCATHLPLQQPGGSGAAPDADAGQEQRRSGSEPSGMAESRRVLVALEEGPRLQGPLVDVEPEKITLGLRVSAHVGRSDGQPAVLFYHLEQGSKEW